MKRYPTLTGCREMGTEAESKVVETSVGVDGRLEVVESGELSELEREVLKYIESQENEATKEAYFYDWKHFTEWCAEEGYRAMPARSAVVATYLQQMATGEMGREYAASTIRRRMTTIRKMHREQEHDDPTASSLVDRAWKAIRSDSGVQVAQEGKRALMSEQIRQMVDEIDTETTKGLRDRAVLLMGFVGGMRRSEIAALDVGDLEFAPEGLEVTIRESKTDQEGKGHDVYLTPGSTEGLCPVEALRSWLGAAEIDEGAVFRNVGRWGNARDKRVSGKTINRAVKSAVEAIGLDPSKFGAHSLRAGHVTERKARGESDSAIMDQTNQSQSTLRRYDRAAKRFRHDTSKSLGL